MPNPLQKRTSTCAPVTCTRCNACSATEADVHVRFRGHTQRDWAAYPAGQDSAFSQTEMCCLRSLVKGSRFQPLQRSRSDIPASRAIRSSSAGHT
jgi:hypothetical protein